MNSYFQLMVGLFLLISCASSATEPARDGVKTHLMTGPGGDADPATLEIAFPRTGNSLSVRYLGSLEKDAPTFTCPRELIDLALTCRSRLPETLVFDPGHAESPNANRSDLETSENPFKDPDDRLAGYIRPEFAHVTKTSVRTAEEDFPARYSKPETHEGNFNLATSLMVKYFVDRCFFERVPGLTRSPVALTRHPSEIFFGEYADPTWVTRTAPPEISARQTRMPILSEVRFEALTDIPGDLRINPALGGGLNSRNAYINHLLGSTRPWAFRLATREEEVAQAPLSPAAYPVSMLRPGFVISHHSDTAPAATPEDPTLKRRFTDKFKDLRARFLAAQGDESRVRALKDEWQTFFYDELKLRSRDVSSIFIPTIAMPTQAPLASDYLRGPAANLPPYEPPFTRAIVEALREHFLPWSALKNANPSAVAVKNPQHLALISGAVQTREKILVESMQLTGQAAGEMIRQVRLRDRRILATARVDGAVRESEIVFTDGQILNARAQAIGTIRGLCR